MHYPLEKWVACVSFAFFRVSHVLSPFCRGKGIICLTRVFPLLFLLSLAGCDYSRNRREVCGWSSLIFSGEYVCQNLSHGGRVGRGYYSPRRDQVRTQAEMADCVSMTPSKLHQLRPLLLLDGLNSLVISITLGSKSLEYHPLYLNSRQGSTSLAPSPTGAWLNHGHWGREGRILDWTELRREVSGWLSQ